MAEVCVLVGICTITFAGLIGAVHKLHATLDDKYPPARYSIPTISVLFCKHKMALIFSSGFMKWKQMVAHILSYKHSLMLQASLVSGK